MTTGSATHVHPTDGIDAVLSDHESRLDADAARFLKIEARLAALEKAPPPPPVDPPSGRLDR